MNRAEHLAWCKRRALDYVELGELPNAVASMGSDMGKRPDTKLGPSGALLHMIGLQAAMRGNAPEVRRWIEGFD